MRVKPYIRNHLIRVSGITPAHAGKTKVQYVVEIVVRDHPRACG